MDTLFEPEPDPEEDEPRAAPPPVSGPLAARMRPRSLDDFVGQEHLLGEGSALRTAIESGHPHSMVLYGPPGTGKTTLARMTAEHADAAFEELSAVNAGRPEVREVIARARQRRDAGRATIFFLDEIHRFNKAQQDALLPAVEEGLVTLIGATTENPYFEVNSALLSRAQIYELQALEPADVEGLLRRALDGGECGDTPVDDEAVAFLAARSGGDARSALNALELACETAARGDGGTVTVADAEDAMQRKAVLYDKAGDQHYDYISAWIKATRGSDPDASLYYLAAMLEGGEDARFIARRMVILASEDVGNADPQALLVADGGRGRRRARRAARGDARARAVRRLPLAGAEVERVLPGARPRAPAHRRPRRGPAAGTAPDRRVPRRAQARARAGLRVPARRARPRQRPGAHAGRARGPPLLRARRRRGRAGRAARRHPARPRPGAVTARYDRIGRSYDATRGEDPRIAAQIWAALGDAETVLNVGAGTGHYEPRDRAVTAVEPSPVMRAQRPPGAAPAIDAVAGALPFADGAFDAAMAILSDHHWPDRDAGLRELRRVASRAVLLQWDSTGREAFWLARDYMPRWALDVPPLRDAVAALGPARFEVVPIPHDCRDGFLMAYWRRPEAYLDPVVRANISVFALMPDEEEAALVAKLRADLETGVWHERNAAILGAESLDLGYRLVVAG